MVRLLLRPVYAKLNRAGYRCDYWADPILQPDLFKEIQANRSGACARLDGFRYTVAYYIYIKGGIFQLCREALALFLSPRRRTLKNCSLKFRAPEKINIAADSEVDPRAILVVGANIPRAEVSAGDLAIIGILENLRQLGFAPVFVPLTMADEADAAAFSDRYGVHVPCVQNGYRNAEDFIARVGKDFATFFIIAREAAQMVLSMCRMVAPSARVIFHAPDVAFLREERCAVVAPEGDAHRIAVRNKHIELSLMQKSDLVVTVSDNDAHVLRLAGLTVPIAVHQALNVPVRENTPDFEDRNDMFFLGNFGHKPNIDAAVWCCREIWPKICEDLPDARLHIIGSGGGQLRNAFADIDRVVFHGFVPDLSPLLLSMRLCLAPLRYGAGIKGKVAMSLGAGVPCVCTSIAAEGMLLVHNETVCVGDSPSEFSSAAVRLYSDWELWDKLSHQGKEHVRRHFTLEANKRSLHSLFGAFPEYSWLDSQKTA